jgi:glycosyltransferase involved in cell wall biosynthesis
MKQNSVSVFISVLNEEKNVHAAVKSVKQALKDLISDWEIIIVDDGSTDGTYKLISELRKRDERIRILKHDKNKGLGEALKSALKFSKKEYFTIFPGDNDMAWQSLQYVLKEIGKADLISGYMVSDNKRILIRRIMSRLYVFLMNIFFGLNMKYYNGPFICRTSALKSIHLESKSMDILAELRIRMIKKGIKYKEIIIEHTGRKYGVSKAYSLKNIYLVCTNTIRLYMSVSFQ